MDSTWIPAAPASISNCGPRAPASWAGTSARVRVSAPAGLQFVGGSFGANPWSGSSALGSFRRQFAVSVGRCRPSPVHPMVITRNQVLHLARRGTSVAADQVVFEHPMHRPTLLRTPRHRRLREPPDRRHQVLDRGCVAAGPRRTGRGAARGPGSTRSAVPGGAGDRHRRRDRRGHGQGEWQALRLGQSRLRTRTGRDRAQARSVLGDSERTARDRHDRGSVRRRQERARGLRDGLCAGDR